MKSALQPVPQAVRGRFASQSLPIPAALYAASPATCFPLPTAHCPLPTAHCPLPTTHFPRRPNRPISLITTLLQTLCRRENSQLLYNQTIPNSFAKTPGVGGTLTLLRRAWLRPSYAPRYASIPCALTRLRILPVTTGVCTLHVLILVSQDRVSPRRAAVMAYICNLLLRSDMPGLETAEKRRQEEAQQPSPSDYFRVKT